MNNVAYADNPQKLNLGSVFYLSGIVAGLGIFLYLMIACIQGSETTWFGVGAAPAFFLIWSVLSATWRYCDSDFKDIDFLESFLLMMITGTASLLVIVLFYGLSDSMLDAKQKANEAAVFHERNCQRIDELVSAGNGTVSLNNDGNIVLLLDTDDVHVFEKTKHADGREQCVVVDSYRKYGPFEFKHGNGK